MLDRARSIAVANEIRAQKRDCYRNALKGLRAGDTYVVGWAADADGHEFAHAWIETPDGAIVDPTAASTMMHARDRRRYAALLANLSTASPEDMVFAERVMAMGTFPYVRYDAVRRYSIHEISAAATTARTWAAATSLPP